MVRLATLSLAIALTALAVVPVRARGPGELLPPKTLGPVESYGAAVQRSMTLMATSSPLKRNTVRVLFYGQSITQQGWSFAVAEHLRRRYPLADLVIENRAIGGFQSEYLVRTAEADLYPFYPDLVILHVYGSPVQYEAIVRRTRERTTADILLATDHVAPLLGESVDEETDPARLTPVSARQTPAPEGSWRNQVFLPGIARKYGTDLADVRGLWKRYLKDHRLSANALLQDGLHLNDRGCYLMGEIIKAHLRHRPELPDQEWADRVKTLAVGTDIAWKDGKLVVPFVGNRVDLLVGNDGPAQPASIRIDGKKPSEFPELYSATRVNAVAPRSLAPPVLRVQSERPCVVEDWTLTVTHVSADRKSFKFKVAGSVTGEDGEGESGRRFVSKSGRVAIDPEDLHVAHALQLSRNPDARTMEARWSVVPMFADEFAPPARANRFGDTVVTVAQGLSNRPHVLEVGGGPNAAITAVRVYRPPLSTP